MPQSSALSCTISGLVPPEWMPGERRMAHREDSGFLRLSAMTCSHGSFQKPDFSLAWGGSLMLLHFPSQNNTASRPTIQGTPSLSPLPKEHDPFVGCGAQVLRLGEQPHQQQPRSHHSNIKQQHNSSGNRTSVVWQLLGNSQPMSLQPWGNCTQTCCAVGPHTPQVCGMTSTQEVHSAHKHFS